MCPVCCHHKFPSIYFFSRQYVQPSKGAAHRLVLQSSVAAWLCCNSKLTAVYAAIVSLLQCMQPGLVLEPLPTGAWAFLSVTAAVFTKTLTFGQAFSAFCNDVIWLIVVSFFFAKVCFDEFTCLALSANLKRQIHLSSVPS